MSARAALLAELRAISARQAAIVAELAEVEAAEPPEPAPAALTADDTMTAQQAAGLVGAHESTMTWWLRTGQVKGIKPRGRWLVRVSDLAHLMKVSSQ